jgi:hypothetical protein
MPAGIFRTPLLLCLATLAGCAAPTSPAPSNSPAYNFNGKWDISVVNEVAVPFKAFFAALTASNGSVTGNIAGAPDPLNGQNPCVAFDQSIPATGAIDTDHNLTLTFSIAGGSGTIQATLADNPATYVFGSLQIVGGTCAMSTIDIAMKQTSALTPPMSTSTQPITLSATGNWGIGADYNIANVAPQTGYYNSPPAFGGALQVASGSVSGLLNFYGSPFTPACYYASGLSAIPVTGTTDSGNRLTATGMVAGGTATITAALESNLQSLADGSYQIVGGPCAIGATPMTIAQYAPLSGTYSGTLNATSGLGSAVPVPNSAVTVTASLTQSVTANASGEFPLTGTINIGGSCTDTFTIPPGLVSGGGFSSIGSSGILSGRISPDASNIDISVGDNAKCNSHFYVGTLTRQ